MGNWWEQPSSAESVRWPNHSSSDDKRSREPIVLESDAKTHASRRWVCGRDQRGEITNPDGIQPRESVQFIACVGERFHKITSSDAQDPVEKSEWQGAVFGHEVLNDGDMWAELYGLSSKDLAECRQLARDEAISANETKIP